MTSTWCACAMALLLLAGCGRSETVEQATPSTSASASTTSAAALPPVPDIAFRDYLGSIGVTPQPVPIAEVAGLEVTVPVPDGWARAAEPFLAKGLEFVQPIGATGDYPSATLMAIRLDGDFDPKDAIRHANVDALSPRATDVTESFDDYQGLPSAQAEGVFDGAEHYSRFVIATVPPAGQRYLVQLTATSPGEKPISQQPELDNIIDGFTVAAK